MSDSLRPHRQQPNRLPCPWDSPGKNTGVGCHFLLQCMKVKSQSEVAQSCPTLSDPMDCSLPGSSVHGVLQARALEWDAIKISYILVYISELLPSASVLASGTDNMLIQSQCRPGEGEIKLAGLKPQLCLLPHETGRVIYLF